MIINTSIHMSLHSLYTRPCAQLAVLHIAFIGHDVLARDYLAFLVIEHELHSLRVHVGVFDHLVRHTENELGLAHYNNILVVIARPQGTEFAEDRPAKSLKTTTYRVEAVLFFC